MALHIDTAQNVRLEYEVASVGERLLAVFIDFVILAGYSFAMSLVTDALDLDGMVPFFLLFLLPWTFYHLACEQFMDGQSIGKRLRRIKVVRRDGREPGIGAYLLRWVLRPVDSFYGIGIVVILVNGKGQRLGDLAAGTTVVGLKQRVRLEETLLVNVAPDHVVRFPRASDLSDGQARFIKDVLQRTAGPERVRIISELAYKVRTTIGVDGAMGDEEFLRAVIADHTFLTGR